MLTRPGTTWMRLSRTDCVRSATIVQRSRRDTERYEKYTHSDNQQYLVSLESSNWIWNIKDESTATRCRMLLLLLQLLPLELELLVVGGAVRTCVHFSRRYHRWWPIALRPYVRQWWGLTCRTFFGFRCLGIESRMVDQYDVIPDDFSDVTSGVRLSVIELRRQSVMWSAVSLASSGLIDHPRSAIGTAQLNVAARWRDGAERIWKLTGWWHQYDAMHVNESVDFYLFVGNNVVVIRRRRCHKLSLISWLFNCWPICRTPKCLVIKFAWRSKPILLYYAVLYVYMFISSCSVGELWIRLMHFAG